MKSIWYKEKYSQTLERTQTEQLKHQTSHNRKEFSLCLFAWFKSKTEERSPHCYRGLATGNFDELKKRFYQRQIRFYKQISEQDLRKRTQMLQYVLKSAICIAELRTGDQSVLNQTQLDACTSSPSVVYLTCGIK